MIKELVFLVCYTAVLIAYKVYFKITPDMFWLVASPFVFGAVVMYCLLNLMGKINA